MKKMRITIDKHGETRIRVEGAVGPECELFTKAFEDRIGDLKQRDYTEDYHRDETDETDAVRTRV